MKLRLALALIFTASILLVSTVQYANSDDLIILGKGNAPIYISNSDSGRFDFSNDGLVDYYVRAHYTGNENQLYKVDYKIQDECVDGSNFETANMKLGFTFIENYQTTPVWINEVIEAWNPWFKSAKNQDNNKLIDLVYLPPGSIPIPYPAEDNGDDLIQGLENRKHGSFTHSENIRELDGQSGWQGSVFFNAPQGEYFMWTIHPATGTEGCDRLAALGIPIIIE